jgi:acylphosphatase
MRIARRFMISGEVQGVGFRFFTQRIAATHQVVGYVRNLKDGRVEVYAEGKSESVDSFKQDLSVGPRFAKVTDIEETVSDVSNLFSSFIVEKYESKKVKK